MPSSYYEILIRDPRNYMSQRLICGTLPIIQRMQFCKQHLNNYIIPLVGIPVFRTKRQKTPANIIFFK